MNNIEILCIAISLSMDAFAVSICKGLQINKISIKETIAIPLLFGIFQFLMPIIGFLLGRTFHSFITKLDHWISFILLLLIGINMIKDENKNNNIKTDIKTILILSIATSIDALAIGITFAFLDTKILTSSIIIGITTFTISILGIKISNILKKNLKIKANLIGGITLIIIGLKILIEGLI